MIAIRVRRLLRILLSATTALSALLFVTTAVAWARSYGHADFVRVTSEPVRVPVTTTQQAQAMQRLGWAGVYTSRHVAVACRAGSVFLIAGLDRTFVKGIDAPPPRLTWGDRAENELMLVQVPRGSPAAVVTPALADREFWGFGYLHYDLAADAHRLFAPAWFVCLATLALPLWRARRFLRRRPRPGRCPQCGYDLRATPDRCPECGTIPAR